MSIEEALIAIRELYDKGATNHDVIRNPVAWALYHAWREADSGVRETPTETMSEGVGHWIEERGGCECPRCHVQQDAPTNYCPECGARLR
ncbi:MAG: hypothetical protein IIZ83_05920 [Oscillospiraceae bacterium]|nr:hypothetical protein [Oscillospiraceae bacterium]